MYHFISSALIITAVALIFFNFCRHVRDSFDYDYPTNSSATWATLSILGAIVWMRMYFLDHQCHIPEAIYTLCAFLMFSVFPTGRGVSKWNDGDATWFFGAICMMALSVFGDTQFGPLLCVFAFVFAGLPMLRDTFQRPNYYCGWFFTYNCIACVLCHLAGWPEDKLTHWLPMAGVAYNFFLCYACWKLPSRNRALVP